MPTPRPPAFQSYPKDWRDVKVRRMSLAAQGAYRAILDDMWADSKDQCSVLDCDPFIAKSLGISVKEWEKLRKEIQHEIEPLFIKKDGRLYSKRLKEEASKQRNYSKLQSERAHKRWDATAMPPHESGSTKPYTKSCSSSSSSSSDPEEEKKKKDPLCPPSGDDYGMARFWAMFPKNPRKVGKGAVAKWFHRHKPAPELVEHMLHKLQQLTSTEQWQKENGKFIPLPMTWLNQGRWQDEVEGNGTATRPPPPPPKTDPIGRGQWGKIYGNPKEHGYD